jgi:5-methylcytosine-specific restriction endonuclease McrA
MKKCSKCGLIKNLSLFEKRKDSKDGLRQYCRECKNKRHSERLKERRSSDESFFWIERAKYLNNPSRRNGKANLVIKSSLPINYLSLMELYDKEPFCFYCKIPLERENIVFDHAIPLSRNGNHEIENIRLSCKDCNNLKHTKKQDEFMVFIKDYLTRFIC